MKTVFVLVGYQFSSESGRSSFVVLGAYKDRLAARRGEVEAEVARRDIEHKDHIKLYDMDAFSIEQVSLHEGE